MVQLVYGTKGSGKTKRLIAMANEEVSSAAGTVVFIDDDNRYMYDVKHEIRFVNVKEYAIDNADKLYGFICGMCAQNFDITAIYFDAFLHMIKAKMEDLEEFMTKLERLADENNFKAVLNVSADPETAPEFMKKHII